MKTCSESAQRRSEYGLHQAVPYVANVGRVRVLTLPDQDDHTSEPRISAPAVALIVIARETTTASRYRQFGTVSVPPVGVASMSDCSDAPQVAGAGDGVAVGFGARVGEGLSVGLADAGGTGEAVGATVAVGLGDAVAVGPGVAVRPGAGVAGTAAAKTKAAEATLAVFVRPLPPLD
jgi:hypothetical protein